jgi:hypothetical protein
MSPYEPPNSRFDDPAPGPLGGALADRPYGQATDNPGPSPTSGSDPGTAAGPGSGPASESGAGAGPSTGSPATGAAATRAQPVDAGVDRMAQALGVLDRALDELASEHRLPTASLVRVAMKRLTYDGFDPEELGFKRFRDFLKAAENDKRIELHDRPGDVVVGRRGAAAPVDGGTVRIRRDLWKSTLDWSPDLAHYLDLETDKIITLPSTPVPLEPEKFANLRDRVTAGDEQLVRIPSIDIRTQVGWMAQFTSTVADAEVQLLLERALASPKSAREFAQVLRSEPAVRYAWNKQLSAHVLVHLLRWKSDEPRLADVQIEATVETSERAGSAPGSTSQQAAGAAELTPVEPSATTVHHRAVVDPAPGAPTRMGGQAVWRTPSASHITQTRLGEPVMVNSPRVRERRARLRLALHRAIDRMPEEELARLVLPAGYLIED